MTSPTKHQHKSTYYNDIALRLGHKLLGLEHLHYGYFSETIKPELKQLPKAQKNYVQQLLAYLPKKNIRHIFDVGCGTGGVAHELTKKKYNVTCLAPDPFLIEETLRKTTNKVATITDLYENVNHLEPESFDLVLMSESCQYIKVKEGWEQNRKLLRPGGYVLVGDFFRIREIDRPDVSKSGHLFEHYLQIAENHGFKLQRKKDITRNVAPTMDIYQALLLDKVFPVFEALFEFMDRRYPMLYRFLRMLLKNKILKLRDKYNNQGSDVFSEYKSYYILLFQKK